MSDNKVKVGEASPWGHPKIGDIYISETLIAQIGKDAVRELVRRQYDAAWRWYGIERRYNRRQNK